MDQKIAEIYTLSLKKIFETEVDIEICENLDLNEEMNRTSALKISSLVSFSGELEGIFLMDISEELMMKMLKEKEVDVRTLVGKEVLSVAVSEMGKEITMEVQEMFKEVHGIHLQMTPAIGITGVSTVFFPPELKEMTFQCGILGENLQIVIAYREK